jgi:ubiquinone/menaquinone biosynthesis C-methylase UbiE
VLPAARKEPLKSDYQAVIRANQELHTVLAASYDATEPQFRPENVAHVEKRLLEIFRAASPKRMLDLGCGTGFLINIAKQYISRIDGVDVTEAMISRVDRSGPCEIKLHLGDTGTFAVEEGAFDVVTAYSFLHHLYDIGPTLHTAARALRPGGKFYADQEPNYYFWEAVRALDPAGAYDAILRREILAVTEKDDEIQRQFQVDKDVFNQAEYNKSITGGFREEGLIEMLRKAGFSSVEISYYWFVGQAAVVNDQNYPRERRLEMAQLFASTLERGLPLTRHLFKYVGFVATR